MRFIRFIVFANILVSLSVGAATTGVSSYFNYGPYVEYGICAFFATLFIYNVQRVMRFEDVKLQSSERHKWLARNRSVVVLSTIMGGIGSLISYSIIGFGYDLILVTVLLLIGLLYAYNSNRTKALRELPFLKIYLIALVWSSVIVIWPSFREHNLTLEPITIAVSIFLYIVAATIPFDIRDLIYDDDKQRTIPQLIGVKASKVLSVTILMVSGIILSSTHQPYVLNPFFHISYAGMTVFVLLTREDRKELFFSGLIDGWIVFLGLTFLFQK